MNTVKPYVFGAGVALTLSFTPAAWADKIDWAKYDRGESRDRYLEARLRWDQDDCQNIVNTQWKFKWQEVSKESMDKCEYTKVTEIIANNEKVLEYEYCHALWQKVRYYRAKYHIDVISNKVTVTVTEPWPHGWDDVAKEGIKKLGAPIDAVEIGVGLLDYRSEAEIRNEAEGLWGRYRRTYQHHTEIMNSTKRYWEQVQRKLAPNCPPQTTTSGTARKKAPEAPKDPVPPQDPVKTDAPATPGGAKTVEKADGTGEKKDKDREKVEKKDVGQTSGGTQQIDLPPPESFPRPGGSSVFVGAPGGHWAIGSFFDVNYCLSSGSSVSPSVSAASACDDKVIKAATDAADTAAAWALGQWPGGAGEAARPQDPVGFWGDACHAIIELSSRFDLPNRDPQSVAGHSWRRASEAHSLARSLGAAARSLETQAGSEDTTAEAALSKAVKVRRGSTEARKLTDEARGAGERAAAARADAIVRLRLGWSLFDLAELYRFHAARIESGAVGRRTPAGGPSINPGYCAERIGYVVALNQPAGRTVVGPGYATQPWSQQPSQYPAGAVQPGGAIQPGTTTQGGVPTTQGGVAGAVPGGVPGYGANPYGQAVPGTSQPMGTFGAPVAPYGGQRVGAGAPAGTFGGGAPAGTMFGAQPSARSGAPAGTLQRPAPAEDLLRQGGGKSGGTTR
jgi:hypothetical protein